MIQTDTGFTLLEVVLSLILFGIMAVVGGMGIVSFTKGFFFAKENYHTAQKAQLTMARLNRELIELAYIANNDNTQPDPYIIYDNVLGRHAIAKNGSIIKMFDLSSGATSLPPIENGDMLMDNVDTLTLSYYKDYRSDTIWVLGTDLMDSLESIEIELYLLGVKNPVSTIVYPRNK
ncbi:type II secretion system protein J [Thermodesulfobacteriota bacterium]